MRYSDTNVSPKECMFQYFHALFDNYYYGMKFWIPKSHKHFWKKEKINTKLRCLAFLFEILITLILLSFALALDHPYSRSTVVSMNWITLRC